MSIYVRLILAVLLCFFFLTSCSQKTEVNEEKDNMKTVEKSNLEQNLRQITVVKDMKNLETDQFRVVSAISNGDILDLVVSYGGGCKDHEWKMFASDKYAKSYPPKLNLYLKHESNNDLCKALLRDSLRFDLSQIQYKGSDVLHLQMNNFDEFVVYKY